MMNVRLSKMDKRDGILEHVFNVSGLDICFFCDTGLNRIGNTSMEHYVSRFGFKWISIDRVKRTGGLGFLYKLGLNLQKVEQKETNVLWVRSEGTNSLMIGGVYRPPSANLAELLTHLQRVIPQYQSDEVIVLGDFNARIASLPSVVNTAAVQARHEERIVYPRTSEDLVKNKAGVDLVDTMNALNMIILNGLNDLALFTCNQTKGSSVIDLVCADAKTVKKITNLEVWEDDWSIDLSDHRLVSFEFGEPNRGHHPGHQERHNSNCDTMESTQRPLPPTMRPRRWNCCDRGNPNRNLRTG